MDQENEAANLKNNGKDKVKKKCRFCGRNTENKIYDLQKKSNVNSPWLSTKPWLSSWIKFSSYLAILSQVSCLYSRSLRYEFEEEQPVTLR